MKVLTFFFLLLSATTLVGAQTPPRGAEASADRPLNLSARKSAAPVTDATVILINPQAGTAEALPYGAGFENRQQGSTAGNGNGNGNANGNGSSGGSGSGGSSGNGGGGRGGSGRGR